MKKDRTGYYMDVEFTYENTGNSEEVSVDIPFDVFVEAIRQYCDRYKDVSLDGTDNSIWNMFAELNSLDNFAEDDDFIELCKEMYFNSYAYEEDYEEWKDDYEFEHNIGKYE